MLLTSKIRNDWILLTRQKVREIADWQINRRPKFKWPNFLRNCKWTDEQKRVENSIDPNFFFLKITKLVDKKSTGKFPFLLPVFSISVLPCIDKIRHNLQSLLLLRFWRRRSSYALKMLIIVSVKGCATALSRHSAWLGIFIQVCFWPPTKKSDERFTSQHLSISEQ